MDPNAALDTLRDADADRDDRIDAGVGLARWIARGGSIPARLVVNNRYAAGRSLAAVAAVLDELERVL